MHRLSNAILKSHIRKTKVVFSNGFRLHGVTFPVRAFKLPRCPVTRDQKEKFRGYVASSEHYGQINQWKENSDTLNSTYDRFILFRGTELLL